ncbi:pyridoxamine 5'-phosphate oxidase [Dysgonomonas sp. 216]|uniref:pyridoxamine 5'-phosphate oxidase n=1 Tax=Dysgonomonas sp. 216 TaxID=2302934 RepID=UPI0013D3914F|nr:pyridoxamine 5'-phosphate oxidase [Dysgonomonas sp. 216]NDW19253.1 pyridoxamine 5'-phosphate oxidase [Dysgonomonas sp. 216]
MAEIFDMREEFNLDMLDEHCVDTDPVKQFERWFYDAVNNNVKEVNAMVLSTVSGEGKPSSRVVLLKQFSAEGFAFFTNYESHKAKDIEINPFCALNFVWLDLERQIRIEGFAEKILPKDSDYYFSLRPRDSQIGAWVSAQSQVIDTRKSIDDKVEEFERRFENTEIPRPQNWGGYIVKPYLFEFWQGRSNRLHDRVQYLYKNGNWIIERLAP